MKDDSIKVGDWVKIIKVGLSNAAYIVESIDDDECTVVLKEGPYLYRVTVKKDEIQRL